MYVVGGFRARYNELIMTTSELKFDIDVNIIKTWMNGK